MGLLFGIGLLIAAAIPDMSKKIKSAERERMKLEMYGPENKEAVKIVEAIKYCGMNGTKSTVYPEELLDLARQYKMEGKPRAYDCAVHDLAKRECEKRGISFTGKYVNTFHLPNGNGGF